MGWGQILQAGVSGWMKGTQFAEAGADRKEDKAFREEQRTAWREDRAEGKAMRTDLADASRPVAAQETQVPQQPATMDNRDVGLPGEAAVPVATEYRAGGKQYADKTEAQNVAAAMNDPAEVAGRQAGVYSKYGQVEKAAALEQRQAAIKKTALELEEKGVLTGLKAWRAGNKDGAVAALKKSKLFPIADDDVVMTPAEVEIPGAGKIKAYDLTFNVKNDDGTITRQTINSHTASMGMLPYEKQIDLMRKGEDSADKALDRSERREDRKLLTAATVSLRESQAAKADRTGGGRGGSGGSGADGDLKSDREYRLQLSKVGDGLSREVRENDARIKELRENSVRGKPNPELDTLVKEQSQLRARRDAIGTEQLELAKKRRPESDNLVAASRTPVKETPYGSLPVVKDKAAYDKLPKGAKYIAPNGEAMTKTK